MAKKLYIGVDGVARKVKKAYIGVDNVARKVKKMYLGVEGVARCIFSGEQKLSYYGTATNLSYSRYELASTTVGNYIGALVNEANDLSFTFTGYNTIYAVPIECISLERGGTNPFGHWYQANDAYFAYVLIQYDDVNSKYVYGLAIFPPIRITCFPYSRLRVNAIVNIEVS